MKGLLFTILIFITISCDNNNDDIKPDIKDQKGFVEGFMKENPEEVKLWATYYGSPVSVFWKSDVILGYTFVPYKDIELTHLGGRIAKKGIYEIDLILMDDIKIYTEIDTLAINQINVTDTTVFQYNEVSGNILLKKDKRYMIRYFMKSIDASYDLVFNDDHNRIVERHPLRTKDIMVKEVYFGELGNSNDGFPIWRAYCVEGRNYLQGLPDFKYELIN